MAEKQVWLKALRPHLVKGEPVVTQQVYPTDAATANYLKSIGRAEDSKQAAAVEDAEPPDFELKDANVDDVLRAVKEGKVTAETALAFELGKAESKRRSSLVKALQAQVVPETATS